jgi:hypothetical protein
MLTLDEAIEVVTGKKPPLVQPSRMERYAAWARSATVKIRSASSSRSLVRRNNCGPVMKQGRQDSYCTGSWRSWVSSARLWRRVWYRRRPETA